MVNPLNIILPFLFAKPKPAATPPEKHPFQWRRNLQASFGRLLM